MGRCFYIFVLLLLKKLKILDINSKKQLSLTATIKILEDSENNDYLSNNNVEYFGEIIEKKSLLWAIKQKIVCDYVIQTIAIKEEKFSDDFDILLIDNDIDKRLFISAFVALKSIKESCSHHLLIYNNNKENSEKIISYITILKDMFSLDLFYSSYHSDMSNKVQKDILENFGNNQYGIISCVYCLGEGWDFPLLDGVVFAENMTSNIRIVQSTLRASRKNKKDTNKKTKIMVFLFGFIYKKLKDLSSQHAIFDSLFDLK